MFLNLALVSLIIMTVFGDDEELWCSNALAPSIINNKLSQWMLHVSAIRNDNSDETADTNFFDRFGRSYEEIESFFAGVVTDDIVFCQSGRSASATPLTYDNADDFGSTFTAAMQSTGRGWVLIHFNAAVEIIDDNNEAEVDSWFYLRQYPRSVDIDNGDGTITTETSTSVSVQHFKSFWRKIENDSNDDDDEEHACEWKLFQAGVIDENGECVFGGWTDRFNLGSFVSETTSNS